MTDRRRRRGQAMAELGIVIVVFVLLVLGIIEYGYAFLELNMITNAARDGARVAAAMQNRGGCGCLTSANQSTITDPSTGTVLAQIRNVMSTSGLSVTVTQSTAGQRCGGGCGGAGCAPPCTPLPAGTIPTVSVTVSGTVPYVFGLVSPNFALSRTVTFQDEQ